MDAGTLELVELEDMLLDHIACQSNHSFDEVCSIVVTCRTYDCGTPNGKFGCGVHEDYYRIAIAHPGGRCDGCNLRPSEHWRVVPV